ncbi:SDR family NAD(P)-dependent oxidoreductase [Promethearchaeum syntrophicum]|uniref:SDR family NAD(P)-dependent oxidoreductase n=1 Tax=Promethearchaeum syntrophicum TaxID=2594042 RepID=A0A5B9DA57_9ARCH|nr:SDR family NAD(P)-dependent oxidoreductase [Candidatus Prometheoarchaeum syntrophicum]QEE16034.1 short chain dehydrogenase [Candidatus Prometheoarchaeum syntrophicum]
MSYNKIFNNKVVLITGGTGFLGRKLTKKILEFNPQSIRLFSRDEVKHHKIQELFNHNNKIRNLIGDVRDYSRLLRAMQGVDIVIHAAALKRLDILEYNVEECIKTNIFGSLNVVNACLECNVEIAVMVSTDKACNPINTYGACKFVSEKLFTERNYNKGKNKTIFTTVRYGNVLESTGSVIPFFEDKIINGEKIPLTDSRMTRFIISPNQSVNLIFNALKFSIGGEIFVPKLLAFKIIELVNILKEKHNASSEIEIIGLRPGEKIHELMMNENEVTRTYEYQNFFVITSQIEEYTKLEKYPIYITEGKKIDINKMNFYRSKEAVISQEKVKELFVSLELL